MTESSPQVIKNLRSIWLCLFLFLCSWILVNFSRNEFVKRMNALNPHPKLLNVKNVVSIWLRLFLLLCGRMLVNFSRNECVKRMNTLNYHWSLLNVKNVGSIWICLYLLLCGGMLVNFSTNEFTSMRIQLEPASARWMSDEINSEFRATANPNMNPQNLVSKLQTQSEIDPHKS